MTIDRFNTEIPASFRAQEKEKVQPEKKQPDVQTTINDQMLKESTNGNSSPNKAMMQLLMSVQPKEQINRTAQNQLSKGFLDVKV